MTTAETLDEVKSRAYLVWAEWGPDRSIPRPERLASLFPTIPQTMRTKWLTEFSAIESEVGAIASQGAEKSMNYSQFTMRLRRGFPFMTDDAIQKAWFLANYYAWHDGY